MQSIYFEIPDVSHELAYTVQGCDVIRVEVSAFPAASIAGSGYVSGFCVHGQIAMVPACWVGCTLSPKPGALLKSQRFAVQLLDARPGVSRMAACEENANWLTLYREAVQENDREKLRVRVAQAQYAMWRRTLELWYAGAPDTTERRQIDAASHHLRFLSMAGVSK